MKEQINGQIYNSQKRRMERLFGDGQEVRRDLDANQELLEEAVEDDDALLALLQLTTQGVRIGFDEKSHRRQLRAHQRLNYLFSMAAELESDAGQASERILSHLKGAEDKLAEIFGAHEWNQLRLNELTLGNLPEASRKALEAELGKQRWEEVRPKLYPRWMRVWKRRSARSWDARRKTVFIAICFCAPLRMVGWNI